MAQARTNGTTDVMDVSKQIDTIREDISTLNTLIAELAKDKSEVAKTHAAKAAADLKSSAADQVDAVQARAIAASEKMRKDAEGAYHQAEDAVRQQPALAVGIAAGLGFLAGLMATRRL